MCPAVNIPVIGFNAVRQSEHFASFFVFGILHVALAIQVSQPMSQLMSQPMSWVMSQLALAVSQLVPTFKFLSNCLPSLHWS